MRGRRDRGSGSLLHLVRHPDPVVLVRTEPLRRSERGGSLAGDTGGPLGPESVLRRTHRGGPVAAAELIPDLPWGRCGADRRDPRPRRGGEGLAGCRDQLQQWEPAAPQQAMVGAQHGRRDAGTFSRVGAHRWGGRQGRLAGPVPRSIRHLLRDARPAEDLRPLAVEPARSLVVDLPEAGLGNPASGVDPCHGRPPGEAAVADGLLVRVRPAAVPRSSEHRGRNRREPAIPR
ncbi:unannotated protein [freshwater metagenome]|uniref:Unannotated protein n=1 Tax=freshwater metagenome TaxID=449393 RepID=A0A6J7LEN1_9ZZZZ